MCLSLSLSRDGVTLIFAGENFDVVGQPLFFYTFSTSSSPAGVGRDCLLEVVCQ